MVAIIGGFLVSRLVSLSTERAALLRRTAELDGQIGLLESDYESVSIGISGAAREEFRRRARAEFVGLRGAVDVDSHDLPHPLGASDDEISRWATDLGALVREAFDQVERAIAPEATQVPPSAELERLGVEVSRFGPLLVDVVQRIQEDLSPIVSLASRMRGVSGLSPLSNGFAATQTARIDEQAKLSDELSRLERMREVASTELSKAGRPEGVRLAAVALTYFAAVGIVLPLVLMSRRPTPAGATARWMVVALFISGLLSLLGYIWWTARGLWEGPRRGND